MIFIISKCQNEIGITTTLFLGRKPQREYPSPIKMNISRIDSKEEYSSSVRMNISRMYYLGRRKTNPLGKSKRK